jgi:hypothetical protein
MQLPRRVFHLAEFSNWSSIERHGLMSAGELMDTAEVSGARREQLEHGQRKEGVWLPSGVYLRDQRPMSPSALAACLHGMVTSEWSPAAYSVISLGCGLIGGGDFVNKPWQHGATYEPTLVCPFAVYFAEAMRLPFVALPHKQFLIQKTADGAFSFVDLVRTYSDLSLEELSQG